MKHLMTGNEALARAAYEAGVHFASGYPGTPSTEILENLAQYEGVYAEWAPNEKVAYEAAFGASMAGGRSLVTMKHVGMNVAADPMFTSAYLGVNGGMVVINADEPNQYSSQNEQDNRHYSRATNIPMFEPSDSQECIDMVKAAYDLSEQYDVPVIIRTTTRVNHSKSLVTWSERQEIPVKPYEKNIAKYLAIPAFARKMKVKLQDNLQKLEAYANSCPWNVIEDNGSVMGVICSGDCYLYAKEVLGEAANYLKLGFSYPLPDQLLRQFADSVEVLYVIEEVDPIVENHLKSLGIPVIGKEIFPRNGEQLPEVIRKAMGMQSLAHPLDPESQEALIGRAPTLCAGCPHRGFAYALSQRKNVMVSGDIGCYTLTGNPPFNVMNTNLCMGASISMGAGAQKVFNLNPDKKMRVVSMIGDSTFFHTGINSLIEVLYNNANTINVILDNRITAMTGQQENPGTGYSLKENPAAAIDLEALCRGLGLKNVRTINPNQLKEVNEALDWAFALDEPSVIITRWPCALKKQKAEEKQEFAGSFQGRFFVDREVCIGCKKCTKTGCPAIVYDVERNRSGIDQNKCVGCSVCAQVCPVQAIQKVEPQAKQ